MPELKIYTIGVYGSSEKNFFKVLEENKIDTFIDIRQRRGVRGAEYAFANAQRLQKKLEVRSIKYVHELGLAPTTSMRETQYEADAKNRVTKRKREQLSEEYKHRYLKEILAKFDLEKFIEELRDLGTERAVFFCVEQSAEACHRSLVTERLSKVFPGITISHLRSAI